MGSLSLSRGSAELDCSAPKMGLGRSPGSLPLPNLPCHERACFVPCSLWSNASAGLGKEILRNRAVPGSGWLGLGLAGSQASVSRGGAGGPPGLAHCVGSKGRRVWGGGDLYTAWFPNSCCRILDPWDCRGQSRSHMEPSCAVNSSAPGARGGGSGQEPFSRKPVLWGRSHWQDPQADAPRTEISPCFCPEMPGSACS